MATNNTERFRVLTERDVGNFVKAKDDQDTQKKVVSC